MSELEGVNGFFQRRAPAEDKALRWPIWRCPPKKAVVGTCISSDLITGPVHYTGKRTVPCLRHCIECPHCKSDVARWKLWIAAINVGGLSRAIVEMTDGVQGVWDDAFCTWRTFKGLQFKLWRRGDRDNGKLFCDVRERKMRVEDVPKHPPLQDMLFTMWEVPELLRAGHPIVLTHLENVELKRAGSGQ
jgi:hypothetical protein